MLFLCIFAANIKHKNVMKKYFLLFILAFAASAMQAQNGESYSIMHHNMEYMFNIENFMRQRNGDLIFTTFVTEQPGPGQWMGSDLGDIFYKMSASNFEVMDSVFVEDPNAPYYLFAPHPCGEGNIRANFEYHEDCDSTFLRICRFPDDDLNINHEEDILTSVCDGSAFGEYNSHFVDCHGDLIMKYLKHASQGHYDIYMARLGVDGTLKHQALVFENHYGPIPKMGVLKESPLKYYQWIGGNESEHLSIIVIDSLFCINPIIINRVLSEEVVNPYASIFEYLTFTSATEVIPIGEDDVLVAANYNCDTNFSYEYGERGVAVAKYDLRTTQQKGYVVFNDYPGINSSASIMGFRMMPDGTVYLLYKETGYPAESFIAVKMDTNLNVEWKRFFKTNNINILTPLYFPIMYEDDQGEEQGVGWAGYGKIEGETTLIHFFLNHDGPVGTSETVMEVRPYCFYPNPAKERLHFEYSPDVQPAKVELYDLQGHLVGTQRSNFEDIDVGKLPAGTYTLRITMEDGNIYSDKVLKE